MVLRTALFLGVVLLLGGLLFLAAASPPEPGATSPETSPPIAEPGAEAMALLERTPLPSPLASPRIRVRKAARKLELLSSGRVVRTFTVGLGFNPVGAKLQQGDGRTPEGEYRVCIKNPNSRFFLGLALNYPNSRDAREAYEEGRITKAERDAIVAAEVSGSCPPWGTALGGNIVIHGRGASADWTLGCVALEDEDMRLLYDAVSVGTPVTIEP